METPLITIAITSYNHAAYIEFALDSVLKEDYPNKAIVIIDDGSTDNSPELIRQWISRNQHLVPVHFISRPNKGLAYTLNELLDNIHSEYLALLASDDAFCNNGLTKRMQVMQQTKKMLVVGDCSVMDNEGNITHRSWMKDVMKRDVSNYQTEEGIMKEVLTHPAISGSVLLLNKKIYDEIGRYPYNFYAEEWFFYQRCAAYRYMVYIDEVVSLYRRHDANTSGSDFSKRKHLVKSIIKSYRMSWHLFPGKIKLIALKQWLRWIYIYIRAYIIQ
ncbi:MAG TPA: glycosyltransferase [Ferruginibacter sp.]|jgi:glycosyltransferase involved in cell wall biosynthesis|nr:glycosyltransferase [Ferruginibacter sp.]